MAKLALLIGVSEYGTGLNSLPSAVRTVELMRQVLQPLDMGGFDEVKQLWNPNPPVMREAIETLFSGRTDDDLVLLFFSGYIIRDDNDKLYLATAITRKSPRAEIIRVTTIPVSFLHELMSNSPCQQQVVILDCGLSCLSERNMGVNDDVGAAIKTQLGGKERTILTSLSSTETFLEAKISSHSVYTRYFVEGVRTGAADLNSDGWISIEELHEYASQRTQIATPAVKPEFYAVENGDDILLSKAPIDDPKLKYRKEAQLWVREGEISHEGRDRLDKFAKSLGVSSKESSLIEDEVLTPYHEYQEKLQRYQREIAKAIRNDYPLSTPEQKELKSLQQSLGLRDEDIAPIEEQITLQLTNFPPSENKIDEFAFADSESESNLMPSMPSSVLPDYRQIPPMQMNNITPGSTDEADESISPMMEPTDQADEPTQLDSHRQPRPVSTSAKTVLQQTTRLLSEPIPPTLEPTDQADEPTQLDSHRQPHPVPSSANTVLQKSTQILPVQPTNPTPTPAVKSSSLADVQTNPPSASPFPNKLLLAIGIGGVLAIVALAIGISTRKPVAPSAERTDKVSSSPGASPNSSSTATKPEKEPSPTAPSSNSQDCTILVNGNLRSAPVSDPDNVVASLREKLAVTGKRTNDGWVQVKLPNGKLVWAHPGIISGASESEMEACLGSKKEPS